MKERVSVVKGKHKGGLNSQPSSTKYARRHEKVTHGRKTIIPQIMKIIMRGGRNSVEVLYHVTGGEEINIEEEEDLEGVTP